MYYVHTCTEHVPSAYTVVCGWMDEDTGMTDAASVAHQSTSGERKHGTHTLCTGSFPQSSDACHD